ncbi:MAG: hypothetical protein ACXWGY_02835 [Chthoniobacterales bacterium]
MVIATNVLIDPERVFGTELFPVKLNANERYLHYVAYRKSEATVDALFFSSSRGKAIATPELSARAGVNYADFGVAFGMITDHLPVLERVIRDKETRGERLRQVFLLLDVDFLGQRPSTNRSPQTYLHPDLTGEDPIRFWIRFLTAIQFRAWKDDMRRASAPSPSTVAIGESAASALPTTPFMQLAGSAASLQRVTTRNDYQRQLALLRRFAQLCRDHGVELIVATSPLHRDVASTLDAQDLSAAVTDVSRITPVWDFGAPPWLSDRPELWTDYSHFTREVGELMLNRIFTGTLPPDGLPFGELHKSPGGSDG